MAVAVLGSLLAEMIVLIGIILILYIIFKLGKFFLGIIANIILGFVSIVLLNTLFNLAIPFDFIVIVITALLGLPGVFLIVVLKLIGITV